MEIWCALEGMERMKHFDWMPILFIIFWVLGAILAFLNDKVKQG